MQIKAKYPTIQHERASKAIVEFFSDFREVEAVLLIGSCARGKATSDSCLDFLVLLLPQVVSTEKDLLEQKWEKYYQTEYIFKSLLQVGQYSHIDLEFKDGCFRPDRYPHGWTTGPDEFELEIGNTLVYSKALWEKGDYLERLKAKWLPYYDEGLRQKRLDMVYQYCLNNIEHVPLYIDRKLYFQSFNRLYDALREFLQALFIFHRTYPIAYDKWIKEEIVEILGKPELYPQLERILEINNFDGQEISDKAKDLHSLLKGCVRE